MSNILYVDCFSGASGDMLLGALLDAGLSLDDLRADIDLLGLEGVELVANPHESHGITGTHFDVIDHANQHPVRNLPVVTKIIQNSTLSKTVKQHALAVFTRLAEAESSVHGTSINEVHFHEIGAVDSLVDIVGFCAACERLDIDQVFASPIPLGSGRITTAHGLIPVPVPATIALLADKNVPTVPSQANTEIVTPTGAALLSTLATFRRPAMHIERIGYGFGTKELPWANMLRVWLGAAEETHTHEHDHGHSHEQAHDHGHEHTHDHEHEHDHGHSHEHAHDHNHALDHDHEHKHEHEHDDATT